MKEITLSEFKQTLEKGLGSRDKLCDARRPDEFREKRIKGAKNIPHDTVSSHRKKLEQADLVYFYCASGKRCKMACETLEKEGFDPNKLVHITGNAEDWEKVGLPVERNGGGLAIQRQVYLLASIVILIGLFLALVSSLWFLLLPAGIGFGMLFSAIRGICYSEVILTKMPWNR